MEKARYKFLIIFNYYYFWPFATQVIANFAKYDIENPARVSSFLKYPLPRFTDTRLIRTPDYYRQFALSLGKESALTFYFLISTR